MRAQLTVNLKFGLAVPSNFWRLDLQQKIDQAQQISAAGFDHLFMADHVSFRDGSGTDGFVEVAALSQLHEQLGTMISIYLLPLRHPLPVARQLATMANIAPGRFMFGIGIGGEDRHEIEICGVDPRTRGARTNESLAIIRSLSAGETVSFAGEHFQIEKARIKPAPRHRIPIIIGGRSDAALHRTARYGDGWIATWCSTRRFSQALQIIDEQAAQCERADVGWLHGYQPWVGVAADEATARRTVAGQMEDFYKVPFEKFERYTPFGTPTQVAEQLSAYAEAGARLYNLKICAATPEQEIEMGAAVIAEIKRMTGTA